MKRIVSVWLVLILLMSSLPALAACDHDLYQEDFAYPTCTTDGYYVIKCTKCSYTVREITDKATGHDWELQSSVEATCTDKGLSTWKCSECDEIKYEYFDELEHKWKESHVLEDATCTTDGTMRIYCTECGLTSSKTIKKGHKYSAWKVTEEATDHSKGTRTRACNNCGKEETETFYPDGTLYKDIKNHTDEVKTLQSLLTDLGYLDDKIDGIFGKKTQAAVKESQKEYGFKQDGIAWPQTINALAAAWDAEFGKPTGTDGAFPEYCTLKMPDGGDAFWDRCEEHSNVFKFADDMMAEELSETELLKVYITAWKDSLERMYDGWFMLCEKEDQPEVLTHKAMFNGYLSSQYSVWELLYDGDEAQILTAELELVMEQCSELCQITGKLINKEG